MLNPDAIIFCMRCLKETIWGAVIYTDEDMEIEKVMFTCIECLLEVPMSKEQLAKIYE